MRAEVVDPTSVIEIVIGSGHLILHECLDSDFLFSLRKVTGTHSQPQHNRLVWSFCSTV